MKDTPSILILDTYYPEFLKSAPLVGLGSYEAELAALMRRCFGTFDAYSRGLTRLGWNTEDVVANHTSLLKLKQKPTWSSDHDVLFTQDLSHKGSQQVLGYKVKAGQCSCAWPGDSVVKRFDILFTSFPHYVERFEKLGVSGVYLPLAFDPVVYERIPGSGLTVYPKRGFDVCFVGGMGSQFGKRFGLIDHIDSFVPTLRVFSYTSGYTPAWGLEMYHAYAHSKIVLNIHHPASEGYSNNLRMFEATGMGALLLTEDSPNIHDFFQPGRDCVTYTSPADAVDKIRYYLDHDEERERIAANGKYRTLHEHTYAHRLPIVDRELRALLDSKI